MWIMITEDIMVSKEYKPRKMDIYWATPWSNDVSLTELSECDPDEFDDLMESLFPELALEDRPYIYVSAGGYRRNVQKMHLITEDKSSILKDMISKSQYSLFSKSPWGFTPNSDGKLRIMVGDEPVGIFPHECSILTAENMNIYINDSHIFMPNAVAHEIFGVFDAEQQLVIDAAMLDGCTKEQAVKVSFGKDPEVGFPPPLGYYAMREEYREYFGL